jgi:hypothetical protein
MAAELNARRISTPRRWSMARGGGQAGAGAPRKTDVLTPALANLERTQAKISAYSVPADQSVLRPQWLLSD